MEGPLSNLIRQIHRWLSIAFTVGVVTNLAVYTSFGKGHTPPFWVNLLVLVPAFLLMLTGLYMFFLPYVRRPNAVSRAAAAG